MAQVECGSMVCVSHDAMDITAPITVAITVMGIAPGTMATDRPTGAMAIAVGLIGPTVDGTDGLRELGR